MLGLTNVLGMRMGLDLFESDGDQPPAFTLPDPILLDSFDTNTGRTNSNATFVLSTDSVNQVEGTGCASVTNTGTTGSDNLTKTNVANADPDDLGVVVLTVDVGQDPEYQNTSSVDYRLGRANTYYTQTGVTGLTGLSNSSLGKRLIAFHVSEVPTLVAAALGPGQIDTRAVIAQSGANAAPYAGTCRLDAAYANAAGRPTVLITFDDIFVAQHEYALAQMQARGFKGTCFVPTANIAADGNRMTLSQIKDLYNAGWDMGCDGTPDDSSMVVAADLDTVLTGLTNIRSFLTANGMTRGQNHGCYPNGNTQAAGTKIQVAAVTCNGTTTLTMGDTTGILPGMKIAGNAVPTGTMVASVTNSTTVVASQAMPSQVKPMSFTDTSGPFHTGKLQDGLLSLGFKSFRLTSGGTVHDRWGWNDQHILMPGNSGSQMTAAQLTPTVDQAILRGTTAMFYFHTFGGVSGLDTATAEFEAFLDYCKAKVDANLLSVLTVSQWEARVDASHNPTTKDEQIPGFSDYTAQNALNWESGQAGMPALGNRFLALFTTAPNDSGSGGTEVSAGGYARVQVAGAATTNATTASGNATLHFASTPAWIQPGMTVTDLTAAVIPAGTTVLSTTSTTVVMSANATGGGVGSGDSIQFSAWPAASAASGAEPATSPAQTVNGSIITFPAATADWGTVVAFGIYDASTSGNLISFDYLGNFPWLPFTCTSASPGVLTSPAHGYSNGNSVVVTQKYGGTLPTTGGSWSGIKTVASVTTDTFTAGVNTTSTGDGQVRKVTQQSIPTGVTASFAASTLTLTSA